MDSIVTNNPIGYHTGQCYAHVIRNFAKHSRACGLAVGAANTAQVAEQDFVEKVASDASGFDGLLAQRDNRQAATTSDILREYYVCTPPPP